MQKVTLQVAHCNFLAPCGHIMFDLSVLYLKIILQLKKRLLLPHNVLVEEKKWKTKHTAPMQARMRNLSQCPRQ